MRIDTDVVIVGTGVGGLFSALNLSKDKDIIMITKSDLKSSDSFLAQGGICVLRNEDDYDSYFEDTMKAGHYENRRESVDIMIRSSRKIIDKLVNYGVEFEKENGNFVYTREGGHSKPRILFHEDITGKEITPSYGPAREGDIYRSSLSNEKAVKNLHWTPEVSLEEGLKRTYQYFVKK